MTAEDNSRLGHDPLEWLMAEDDEDLETPVQAASESAADNSEVSTDTPVVEATDTTETAAEAAGDEDPSSEGDVDSGTDHGVTAELQSEPEVSAEADSEEEQGYGFFEPEPEAAPTHHAVPNPVTQAAELEDDPDAGYGFFTTPEPAASAPLEDDPDEGYGFFTDPAPVSASAPVLEDDPDQGYGFFDNEETGNNVPLSSNSTAAEYQLILPSQLLISEITGIQQLFKQSLESDKNVSIDAGEVEDADAAGIQLLLAGARKLNQAAMLSEIVGINDVLKQKIRHMGLTEQLTVQSGSGQ